MLAGLPSRVRQALDHPLRREILRDLDESPAPRSSREVWAALGGDVALSEVCYHLWVLEDAKSVRRADFQVERVGRVGDRDRRGGCARLFAAAYGDSPQIVAVLDATRESDHADE